MHLLSPTCFPSLGFGLWESLYREDTLHLHVSLLLLRLQPCCLAVTRGLVRFFPVCLPFSILVTLGLLHRIQQSLHLLHTLLLELLQLVLMELLHPLHLEAQVVLH